MSDTAHGAADPAATADRLLAAHVEFQIAELRSGGFAELVEREVAYALDRADELTLAEVVSRDDVTAVAHKYVAAFDLPGAIPEVVGDIATRVRAQAANDTPVHDIVPRRHAEAFIGKVAQLRPVREWIAVQITESAAVQAWLANYLHSLTAGAVESNLRLARKVPGVSLGLNLGNRVVGGAVREADQRSREMSEQAAVALLGRWREKILTSTSDEDVEEALLEMWDKLTRRQMAELLAAVDDDDLVDFASIVYDAWLDVRDHAYLLELVETGVRYFYDTYGDLTLTALLEEFGLTRADLVEEAMRFAPRAIDALADSGVLADVLRRHFGRFYASATAREILAGAPSA